MHLILKIGISRNTECVHTVGFPKLGHKYNEGKIFVDYAQFAKDFSANAYS